ncbi:MAG: hypothetical protein A2600_02945 [Candidatus Lambdaproteobacteria bacterium RIFOXYD1_FULL_56_27]|uniref:Prokaryotic-type class I peptide chain release factors domain-containing protein n=1 Tax=Candidatus Lambdaproteobacteria bacterium RIFOXYD2_FULL_56_26 TaxID=1817773 RepID=A0A1F6H2X5_9PROT|nr:MAG: hypothetical protein A2557_07010 [Candidatus Lambdaproteobacteria bacterium RIFOXYD2_FULL_56_26]OGH05352.1 MAG: hypothetical protein A2426_05335 [Candidatus Lambdaproteobacteria bacterium RIFOXYC1_FULL_56_13]OGH09194.1 MAG: hypothetical protein A2600_02945 [Candidatus Lambdaproteobacteria bacterium RIFOXYD1_FULL_56_27]
MKSSDYSPDRWLDFLRLTDPELVAKARRDVYKSGGKGGQKKNKVENAIRLTLGRLQVSDTASRSKEENLAGALRKLRLAIALDYLKGTELRVLQVRPPKEIQSYLGQEEIRINPKNPAYPLYIGYFLDRFLAQGCDFGKLALELGTSKSQVRKFVERYPALLAVTREAQEFGLLIGLLRPAQPQPPVPEKPVEDR